MTGVGIILKAWKNPIIAFFLVLTLLAGGSCRNLPLLGGTAAKTATPPTECLPRPRYGILMIGDGMGAAQIQAGSLYMEGKLGALSFEHLPHHGLLATFSTDDSITDSAAAATAMATGQKVGNGVLGLKIPGDGAPLRSIREIYQAEGKSTGLVTTTYISHATPAAFAVHQANRHQYDDIVEQIHRQDIAVLLGGSKYIHKYLNKPERDTEHFRLVKDREELLRAAQTSGVTSLWGFFGNDHFPYEADGLGALPHLTDMTRAALEVLERDPDGFFLMVEGGRIDHAGHDNDITRLVGEMTEFSRAVTIITSWAASRPDALVVITADHETGGLTIIRGNGKGQIPNVEWRTEEHTGVMVPIYAMGQNATEIRSHMDNTEVFRLLGGCPVPALK